MPLKVRDKVVIISIYKDEHHARRNAASEVRKEFFGKEGTLVEIMPNENCSLRIKFPGGIYRNFVDYGIVLSGDTIFDE